MPKFKDMDRSDLRDRRNPRMAKRGITSINQRAKITIRDIDIQPENFVRQLLIRQGGPGLQSILDLWNPIWDQQAAIRGQPRHHRILKPHGFRSPTRTHILNTRLHRGKCSERARESRLLCSRRVQVRFFTSRNHEFYGMQKSSAS